MGPSNLLFAYFGPETMLPLTSGVAGVIGALLVLGRRFWGVAARRVRVVTKLVVSRKTRF